jgi:hypothetical protein
LPKRKHSIKLQSTPIHIATKYSCNIIEISEPQTLLKALEWEDANLWKQTINEEYQYFIKNGTWELMELPNSRKPMSCTWVFQVKHNAEDEVD